MSQSNEQKRLALFDVYSQNASFFETSRTQGIFVCPICLRCWERIACVGKDCSVNLAHVYPASCGGNVETLACASCNSKLGSKYDSQIALEHKINAAWNEESDCAIAASVKLFDEKVQVNLSRTPRGMMMVMSGAHNSPEVVERLSKRLEGNIGDFEFTILHRAVDVIRFRVAILYGAHLLLFREFGYEYICSDLGKWVRQVAVEAATTDDQLPFPIMGLRRADGFDSSYCYRVMMLTNPHEHRTMWVTLPTPDPAYVARAGRTAWFDRRG